MKVMRQQRIRARSHSWPIRLPRPNRPIRTTELSSRVGGQLNYFSARTTIQAISTTCILPSFKFVSDMGQG